MMALWRRGRPQLLKDLRITYGMSRSDEVCDNSVMEGFFSSLKAERTARKNYFGISQRSSECGIGSVSLGWCLADQQQLSAPSHTPGGERSAWNS